MDLVGDRRTIIFSPTAGMARRVAEIFNEFRPGQAKSLDGTAPDLLRQKVYAEHQSGVFQFLSVCGLCREGYNDPGIAAVAVYRPTKSRSLAEQMKGRGCRPLRGLVDGLPDAEARRAAIAASSKPDCLIVDLVGITGMPPVVSTADILANGLPDEVIDRASAAIESNPDADMQDELRKAKAVVDEETAERERQVRELREREEAARQARLKVEVQYEAKEVDQGAGGAYSYHPEALPDYRWPYGHFKDWPFSKLPTKFLQNACHKPKVKGKLRDRVLAELERRDAGNTQRRVNPLGPVTEGQWRLLRKFGLTASTFSEAAMIIKRETGCAVARTGALEEAPF